MNESASDTGMSNENNILGKAGEAHAQAAFLKGLDLPAFHSYPRYLFDATFLGEKNELFDILVSLYDHDAKLTGAHFFVQVKTTGTLMATGAPSVPAKFTAAEIKAALRFKVPAYLVAVTDDVGGMKAYVRGIHSSQTAGVSTVSTRHLLREEKTKVQIYNDVTRFFTRRKYTYKGLI